MYILDDELWINNWKKIIWTYYNFYTSKSTEQSRVLQSNNNIDRNVSAIVNILSHFNYSIFPNKCIQFLDVYTNSLSVAMTSGCRCPVSWLIVTCMHLKFKSVIGQLPYIYISDVLIYLIGWIYLFCIKMYFPLAYYEWRLHLQNIQTYTNGDSLTPNKLTLPLVLVS